MYLTIMADARDAVGTKVNLLDDGRAVAHVMMQREAAGRITQIIELAIHTPTQDGADLIAKAFEAAFSDRDLRNMLHKAAIARIMAPAANDAQEVAP